MDDIGLREVYTAVGSLTEAVAGLRRDLQSADRRTSESRATMYARIDDLAQRTGVIETSISQHVDRLKQVEVVADEVRMWKQRGVGALFMAGIAGSFIGAIASVYWRKIVVALTGGG